MLDIFKFKIIFWEKYNGNGLNKNYLILMKMKLSLLLLVVEFKFYQRQKLYKRNGIFKVNRDY